MRFKEKTNVVFPLWVWVFYLFSLPQSNAQGTIEQAMIRAADYLVANQSAQGYWDSEYGFVGESTIGLCDAYLKLPSAPNRSQYKGSAEQAGAYIWSSASYNPSTHLWGIPPYAAEAYALTKLSDISSDPNNNQWRDSLVDFFNQVRTRQGLTQGFIDGIIGNYPSDQMGLALYDLSRFGVAAQYVNDQDTGLWRQSIIDLLGDLGDNDYYQVLGLAVSVWALSKTGSLDNTPISGTSPYFNGKTLSELPDMLAALQAPDGSFYWNLDGTEPGGTDVTFLATLALDSVGGYGSQVAQAINTLAGGVDSNGACYLVIGDSTSGSAFYFSGETLEAIRPLVPTFIRGDANSDGALDLSDAVFILQYLFAAGQAPSCQDSADSNDDGFIDISDSMKILMHLFGSLSAPPSPYPDCGEDPTSDSLDCESYSPCGT